MNAVSQASLVVCLAIAPMSCAHNASAQDTSDMFRTAIAAENELYGVHFALDNSFGSGPGFGNSGFTKVDTFVPFAGTSSSLWFTDFQMGVSHSSGGPFTSTGFGHRYIFDDAAQNMIGASLWLEVDATRDANFQQGGLSIELSGIGWSLMANGYLPLGAGSRQVQTTVTPNWGCATGFARDLGVRKSQDGKTLNLLQGG